MFQEPHNELGVVDDNLVCAPDDLLIFTWSSKKEGRSIWLSGATPLTSDADRHNSMRLGLYFPSWTAFPAQSTIAMATISSSTGLGPEIVPRSADNLRGPRLEITRHHTVEPAAKHRILSERARKKLDLVGRSGYTHACHTPFLTSW